MSSSWNTILNFLNIYWILTYLSSALETLTENIVKFAMQWSFFFFFRSTNEEGAICCLVVG